MNAWRTMALSAALVLSLVLPGTVQMASASPGAWTSGPSMSTARLGLAAVSSSPYVYAIGGYNSTSGYLNSVEAYNPSTGVWAARAPMPTARMGLAAVVSNGRIVAFGGNTTTILNQTEAYTIATNSWSSLAPMPTPRTGAAAVVGPDGRIYVIGGNNGSGYLSTVDVYSPATNTWSTVAPMPTARGILAAVLGGDGRIYAIGGRSTSGIPLTTVQAYAIGTNTWTTVAPMTTARAGLAAVVGADGQIYAIAGTSSSGQVSTVEAYSLTSNTWQQAASMNTARDYTAAAAWPDGRIFVLGGRATTGAVLSGTEISSTIPATPTPPVPINLVATPGNGQVTLTWSAPYIAPGNALIDHYTVDVYAGATHVAYFNYVAGSPFTVSSLTNGVLYQFSVSTVDVLGQTSYATTVQTTPVRPVTAPAAPTNIIATFNGSGVVVNWALADNGGSPITGYVVTAYLGASNTVAKLVNVAPSSLSTLVTGLAHGSYSFAVQAVNVVGVGPYSVRSNTVLAASAPGAPQNVTVTPGDRTIAVRWSPPATDGGSALTGYTVRLYVGSTLVSSVTVAGTSVSLTNLTNNVTYTVAVLASNAMGFGDPALATAVPYNAPPVLTVPGTQTVEYSDSLSFVVSARGPEPTDHLTFTAAGLPAGLTFVDNGNGTGTASGAVTALPGSYPVTITVSDGSNPPVTQTVNVTVTKESLVIQPSSAPASVSVKSATGTVKSLTLSATIRETDDAVAGDLVKAGPITYTLQPVVSGKSYSVTVLHKTSPLVPHAATGMISVKATFKNVVQNVYRVVIGVNSAYYEAAGYSMLTVSSPAAYKSVSAEGDLVVNNAPTYFRLAVTRTAAGKTQSVFRYIEQHPTGDVTLTGTLVGGVVVKGHYASMQLKGSMNGVSGYRFGIGVYDRGTPGKIDRVSMVVISPTAAVVQGCTFTMNNLLQGDAIIGP